MKRITTATLIKKANQYFSEMGYRNNTVKTFNVDFNLLSKYLKSVGQQYYSPKTAADYISLTYEKVQDKKLSYSRFASVRRSTELLNQYFRKGKIELSYLSPWRMEKLDHRLQKLLDDYLAYLSTFMVRKSVMRLKSMTRNMLLYFEKQGHTSLKTLKGIEISNYLVFVSPNRKHSMRQLVTALKPFFKYAVEKGLAKQECLYALNVATPKFRHLSPFFTREESKLILDAVDRNTAYGKRDFAILLLACRLGLRATDITGLCYENIDWDNSCITIHQSKTGKLLSLPLEPEVGNAIADYILNARPISESRYIFLRKNSPHKQISSGLHYILKKYVAIAGLSSNQNKGMYCFRRSLATLMLQSKVPLEMISQVLGHTCLESAKPYLNVDNENLKACALGFSGIEVRKAELL